MVVQTRALASMLNPKPDVKLIGLVITTCDLRLPTMENVSKHNIVFTYIEHMKMHSIGAHFLWRIYFKEAINRKILNIQFKTTL